MKVPPWHCSWIERGLIFLFKPINALVPWHRLPKWLGVLNLIALRAELREKNLHDTDPDPDPASAPALPPERLYARVSEGWSNDLQHPMMGCALRRFGRNVPRTHARAPSPDQLMRPSPRLISEKLLKREKFQPATTLNLLAAAWIQFQVHDWVAHEEDAQESHSIPLPPGDSWPQKEMRVRKTKPDAKTSALDEQSPAYRNTDSHWWDGSQIYGSDTPETQALRHKCPDGKLELTKDFFLPVGDHGMPLSGFTENWWIGLEFLHTLFAREHNAICDRLRLENPHWPDEQIFDTARLVNTALMAKIHTVEWTPGILDHPVLQVAMNANWFGLFGENITRALGRLSDSDVLSGIPGSEPNHHGAPYALTEEFAAVYRLHSLIPDEIAFYRVATGEKLDALPFKQTAFFESPKIFKRLGIGMADLAYTLGRNNPGALRLNNFPNFLRDLIIPDSQLANVPPGGSPPPDRHLDLGAVDILRDRERGVPRYNEFRRLLHLPALKTFEELTEDQALARKIREVYEGELEDDDLLVGTLAEPLPKGFGFSDTIFRIFILMASRRLKSDRFFTTDWRPEVYTPGGLAWVQTNTMRDVLIRHYPELRAALRDSSNAFAPWGDISAG